MSAQTAKVDTRPVDTRTGKPIGPMAQPGYYPEFSTLRQQKFWDAKTREVVLDRVNNVPEIRFFSPEEARLLKAVCDRVLPQDDRDESHKIPIVPQIDKRLYENSHDGYRYEDMPPDREAFRLGLRANRGDSPARVWPWIPVVSEMLATGHRVKRARPISRVRRPHHRGGRRGPSRQPRRPRQPARRRRRPPTASSTSASSTTSPTWPAPGATERAAIETFGEALEGSDRPFLLASGVAGLAPGRVATEHDGRRRTADPTHRAAAPRTSRSTYADRGVRSVGAAVRADRARRGRPRLRRRPWPASRASTGVSGYVGDGAQPLAGRAPARRGTPGAARARGRAGRARSCTRSPRRASRRATSPRRSGAASASPSRPIAPEDAAEHFGWIGRVLRARHARVQRAHARAARLGAHAPGLLEDLDAGYYTAGV